VQVGKKTVDIYPSVKTNPYGMHERENQPYFRSGTSLFQKIVIFFKSILKPTSWFTMFSMVTSSVRISEELCIFGILKFDKNTGGYFMDKPIGIVANQL